MRRQKAETTWTHVAPAINLHIAFDIIGDSRLGDMRFML